MGLKQHRNNKSLFGTSALPQSTVHFKDVFYSTGMTIIMLKSRMNTINHLMRVSFFLVYSKHLHGLKSKGRKMSILPIVPVKKKKKEYLLWNLLHR